MISGKWSALIADDEPAARRGVRQLLAAFPEFAVAGECRNGAEVLQHVVVVRAEEIVHRRDLKCRDAEIPDGAHFVDGLPRAVDDDARE